MLRKFQNEKRTTQIAFYCIKLSTQTDWSITLIFLLIYAHVQPNFLTNKFH